MVRFAKKRDLSFLKHAWEVCFDDPQAFIDWNFEKNFCYHDTLIAEVDGVPASNLQLMPHRISLRGHTYAINYISGVATLPEYRNRGLVRELFAFSFPEMQKRNHPISLLVPFNYEFYEKFGYKQCYEKKYRYADTLPEGDYLTGKDLSAALIARLDKIYLTEMQHHTGYALRTPLDWQKILEDLLFLSQGRIWLTDNGYALIASRQEGGLELHEICGKCALAYREEVKPFAMARIVDATQVLTDFAPEFTHSIRLKIRDEQISKNNLTVEIANGIVSPCTAFDIELDIKDLTTELFGVGKCSLLSCQNPYLNMIF